ncbi:MAG: MFS transporter [Nostocaceae cyanobacterium]|nr:MFS transporter [Nostocaceae cyanobacterium]
MLRIFNIQLRHNNLLVLFAAGLLFWSSLASLLPTLPLYIEELGANKQQIGIVMGSFAIGLLLSRVFLGYLADTRGRKIVLQIGMLVAVLAPLGYNFVSSISLLMVIRAFHGISIAAFSIGFISLVADLAPTEKRGEVIGYMSLVNPVGMAIGPAIGGYLQEIAGWTPALILAAILASLGLLSIIPIVNPPIHTQPPGEQKQSSFWQILLSPRVRVPALILLLIGIILGALHTFVPLFIKSTGVDLNAGLFYTTAAIASFSARFFTGKASDRLGRGLFVTLSLIGYTIAMVMLWTANSKETFLLAAIVDGAAAGTIIPMISAMLTDRAQPQERGRLFASSLMGFDIGLGIAGPVVGFLAQEVGYRNIFGYAALLATLGILIFLTQSSKGLPNSLRFALGRGKDAYALNSVRNL